jgi:DNA mismatch repair protein MutL
VSASPGPEERREGPPVRLLHSRVVDQIAAGEVVERPASVVKELLENALDAGARAIDVLLRDGGRALVRVSDDGHGMRREDALLAIERHATSKIGGIDDLVSVRTLGFRGEALPSIAAVSRFDLVTRCASEDAGTQIRMLAGQLSDVKPAGAAPGTVVSVRDLFHTLPARRAFLRSATTEASHCAEAVVRAALVRTDVAFSLRHDDRDRVRTAAGESVAARAASLLGLDPARLVAIDASDGLFRLRGVAAHPDVHRSAIGTAIYLYVGGRWVRDPLLRRAVHTAYRDRLPAGRHPVVVLDLEVPDGAVDVNVHPTKAEVRFHDPSGVATFVAERLRAAVRTDPPRAGVARMDRRGDVVPALPFTTPCVGREGAPPPLDELRPAPAGPSPLPPDLPDEAPASPSGGLTPATPEPLAAEPLPGPLGQDAPEDAVLVGVVRERWLAVARGSQLLLVDGGRLARRFALEDGGGEARRLMIPARIPLGASGLDRLAALEEALVAQGLVAGRFSASEAVIRAIPAGLVDVDPAEILRVALEHPADPRSAWVRAFPPAEIGDAEALLRRAASHPPLGPVVGVLHLPG